MFSAIRCIGHVARALDHDLAVVRPGRLRELARACRARRTAPRRWRRRSSPAAARRPARRRRRSASGSRRSPRSAVEERLPVVREAPLRHDRAAARDDPGDPLRRQRHVGEAHARVDREVVDALLGLLDERVAEDLPRQLLGLAVRPSRAPGRSARCRSARASCGGSTRASRGCCVPVERSMTVSAPQRVDQVIFSTSSSIEERDGGVADVRVDLDEELPADRHRLGLGVVDVGRDDRAAARDLVAHELRRACLRGSRRTPSPA